MSVFAPAMTVDDPRNIDAEAQINADGILPATEETGLLQDSVVVHYTVPAKPNGALPDDNSGGASAEKWWTIWLRRTMIFISIMILTFLAGAILMISFGNVVTINYNFF